MSWGDNCVKSDEMYPIEIPNQMSTYQVWWKSVVIYSSCCPETKIPYVVADNSVKNWQNLPIRSPQYQCSYQVWPKSIDIYSSYHLETKIWSCCGQVSLSKIDEICPLAITNQISAISMHFLTLVKIYWHLLKLSFGNEKSDVSQADNSVKDWWTLSISNPKPDLHNINAHIKFRENPLKFT